MSRLRRIADRDRIFFITTNLAAKVPHLDPAERDAVLRQLARQRMKRHFLVFAYVAMPDHLHLLLSPQRRGVVASMHEFKRITAERLARSRRSRGPIWQARYFDFILRRVEDFWEKLAYIHENPVAAQLAPRATDWQWSSARFYERGGKPPVPVDPINLPADSKALLWPAPWR